MKRKDAEALVAGIQRGFDMIEVQEERQITIDAFFVLTSTFAAIAKLCHDNGFNDLFEQVEDHLNAMAELLQASALEAHGDDAADDDGPMQ